MTDNQPPSQGNPSIRTSGSVPPPPPAPGAGYQTAPIPGYQYTAPYQPVAPEPQMGVDNTGVPTLTLGSTAHVGTTFFKALFDMNFRTFITRKLATVIYAIGLLVIGLGSVLMLLSGLAAGLGALSYSPSYGLLTIFGSLIGVPLGAIVFVIILRLSVEAGVALVAVAENTEQTAANTVRH